MTNLQNIISTYEKEFDEKFGGGLNSNPLYKKQIMEYLRQFAADVVREAFAETKVSPSSVEWDKTGDPEREIWRSVNVGRNAALSEVESRQQQFINEQ